MPRLFIILLILASFAAYSQSEVSAPYQYVKLDDNQVIYERVFLVEEKSAAEIEKMLTAGVSRVKNLKGFSKDQGVITGKIEECYIDYKKYGGKWGNTAVYMNHPFFANVSVVWKDGRYRVTLSNMEWHTAGLGLMTATSVYTKRGKGEQWDTAKIVLKSGEYLENYFSDLFDIKASKDDW